jgi:hypothetical protein
MGPMRTKSIGAYILTYICSQTEYSFTYFLKNKSEHTKNLKNSNVVMN